MRHKLIPAVHLFLIKNGKILLSKRKNTGYEDGNYSVPSGHVDKGETFTQAMHREAKEEIGAELENLQIVHIMHRKKKDEDEERIDFFFIAEWIGEIKNNEPHKCEELKWFELEELPTNIIPYVEFAIKCFLEKQKYSEFGWD